MAKSPATGPGKKIGSLFFNFGGPGAFAAPYVEFIGHDLFPVLNERFDIVGMDPRGTDIDLDSENSIYCNTDPETGGFYSMPFTTPFNLDAGQLIKKDKRYVSNCIKNSAPNLLQHASTADVARDLDFMRKAVGDDKMTYLGFSYGTFLGATYASLFPGKMRAVVLDGALDAKTVHQPPDAEPARADERRRARDRPHLPGLRARPGRVLGLRRRRPVARVRRADRPRRRDADPGARLRPRPAPDQGRRPARRRLLGGLREAELGRLHDAPLAEADKGDGSAIRQQVDENWYGA